MGRAVRAAAVALWWGVWALAWSGAHAGQPLPTNLPTATTSIDYYNDQYTGTIPTQVRAGRAVSVIPPLVGRGRVLNARSKAGPLSHNGAMDDSDEILTTHCPAFDHLSWVI